MVPNLTEEQTLVKYFKYFDLENSGFCTIRDWIKAVEKIGIIVSKTSELQKIFKHYDTEDKGIFNYKKFANNLFSLSKQIISNSQSKQNVIE